MKDTLLNDNFARKSLISTQSGQSSQQDSKDQLKKKL
jgi:hypothetical protein